MGASGDGLTHHIGGEIDDGQYDEGSHFSSWITLFEWVPVWPRQWCTQENVEEGVRNTN